MNLEDETSELVKSTFEVNNGSLSNMGFTKINWKWVSKDGEQGGSSSGFHAEHGEKHKQLGICLHQIGGNCWSRVIKCFKESKSKVFDERLVLLLCLVGSG